MPHGLALGLLCGLPIMMEESGPLLFHSPCFIGLQPYPIQRSDTMIQQPVHTLPKLHLGLHQRCPHCLQPRHVQDRLEESVLLKKLVAFNIYLEKTEFSHCTEYNLVCYGKCLTPNDFNGRLLYSINSDTPIVTWVTNLSQV